MKPIVAVTSKVKKGPAGTDDCSGSEDDINYLGDTLIVPKAKPAPSQIRKGKSSASLGDDSAQKAPRISSGAGGKPKGKDKGGLKQFQEVGVTSTVLLECQQMISVASSHGGFESLTLSAVAKLLEKVQKRSGANLVKECTATHPGFTMVDEGEALTSEQMSQRGVDTIRNLHMAQQTLVVVQDLVVACNCKQDVDDERVVCSALRSATMANFSPPLACIKVAYLRACRRVLGEGDIGKVAAWLLLQEAPDQMPGSLADCSKDANVPTAQTQLIEELLLLCASEEQLHNHFHPLLKLLAAGEHYDTRYSRIAEHMICTVNIIE